MTRIFVPLAVVNILAMIASLISGTASKLGAGLQTPEQPAYLVHFTLGLLTALLTLFVHCLIFTYFLGTGRWVKEVALAYGLPDALLPRWTRQLKRGTFPPALCAMLVTIATAGAGAGVQWQNWPWYAHGLLAAATLVVNLWAYRIEYRGLRDNAVIIDTVMGEVERIRAERGLPSNAQALEQESV